MSEFKEGDVVKLKSGSPMMTVSLIRTDGSLILNWYDSDSNSIKTEIVQPIILRIA